MNISSNSDYMFILSNEAREFQETDPLTSMLQFSVICKFLEPKYMDCFFILGGGGALKITPMTS